MLSGIRLNSSGEGIMEKGVVLALLAVSLSACSDMGDAAHADYVIPGEGRVKTVSPVVSYDAPVTYEQKTVDVESQSYKPNPESGDLLTSRMTTTTTERRTVQNYTLTAQQIRNPNPDVPASMMPPAGQCRIWFWDKPDDEQPPVRSCDGIRGAVPYGAFAVYGQ